ncbi:hypothetical protein, partial [Candidatus Frankia alpina]|uniref:hypothetical protein n=1 Tax=Candidatus Frankia alpina TaxID=2699483 RepID=UPI001A9838F2
GEIGTDPVLPDRRLGGPARPGTGRSLVGVTLRDLARFEPHGGMDAVWAGTSRVGRQAGGATAAAMVEATTARSGARYAGRSHGRMTTHPQRLRILRLLRMMRLEP